MGFMMAFRSPRIKATISAVVNVSTLKPGTKLEVIKIASAESIQLARVLIT